MGVGFKGFSAFRVWGWFRVEGLGFVKTLRFGVQEYFKVIKTECSPGNEGIGKTTQTLGPCEP